MILLSYPTFDAFVTLSLLMFRKKERKKKRFNYKKKLNFLKQSIKLFFNIFEAHAKKN